MFFNNDKRQLKKLEDTLVFTTKFVLDEGKKITVVTHEKEDGAWQFFSDDKFDDFKEVIRITLFKQILLMDPSIRKLSSMPEGHYAILDESADTWRIRQRKIIMSQNNNFSG